MSQASAGPETQRLARLQPAQDHGHAHRHDHADPHSHSHSHGHSHGHAHDPALIRPPGFSLLRVSAAARLAGAGALSAVLWAAVAWALS